MADPPALQYKSGPGYFHNLPLMEIGIYFLAIVLVELLGDWLWDTRKFLTNWAPFIAMTGGILIANLHFSRIQMIPSTRRDMFKFGMKFCLITMLLLIVYRLTYFTFLFPHIKLELISDTETEMSKRKDISESEIAFVLDMMDKTFLPSVLIGSVLTSLTSGFFGSCISVLCRRRRPATYSDNRQQDMLL